MPTGGCSNDWESASPGRMPAELERALRRRRSEGLYRRRKVVEGAQGVEVTVSGRSLINFCSNDYLGLASHPRLVEAMQSAAARYGVGGGASHLVCGHMAPHHALEEELADFTGRDRALLFSTGYQANLGVIGALCGRGDWVAEDRLNHASLLDGARLAGARLKRYPHGDAGALAAWLREQERVRLVATDGVFSMDGDVAPVGALVSVVAGRHGWLYVDDAHGFGVLGRGGRGTLEQMGLRQEEVPVYMATLGKAAGVFGAFVAGPEALIETLIQQARTYLYTTALPPAVAEAARAGLRLLREESWRRERLRALLRHFRAGAQALGLPLMASRTPIQPLLIGDNHKALAASERLWQRGLWVTAIRPPTVPAGTARLRITLSAAHSRAHVDRLLEVLAEVI